MIAAPVSRIRVLPEALANRIAAGEVVERPSSVVKELVENALDAGARRVVVELEEGGRQLVRVTDDGCGMDRDDALLAFEPHATSKIASDEDLAAPSTFGFRGEALPAIASCSRVTLTTAERDGDGTRVRVEHGKLKDVAPAGAPRGTVVEVRALFSSLPARRKFLRSSSTELSHVLRFVEQQALTLPGLHLSVVQQGRALLELPPAPSVEERVAQLLGRDFMGAALRAGGERDGLRVQAWLVRAGLGMGRFGPATTLVNGRLVSDRLLMRALREAGQALFGVDESPAGLLLVELPPGEVDVNVHPAKREVRFASPGLVHDTVRDLLRGDAFRRGFFGPAVDVPGTEGRLASGGGGAAPPGLAGAALDAPAPRERHEHPVLPGVEAGPVHRCSGATPASPWGAGRRVLGQHRNTYILVEDEQGLVLVDQHCAHERVLFERILDALARGAPAQALLSPVVVEVPRSRAPLLLDRLDDLRALGFDVEPFGESSFRIGAVPETVGDADPAELLLELAAQDEPGLAALSGVERLAATTACKAAVKAGFPLGHERLKWLVDELFAARVPTTCPHGRVALLRLSDRDLDHRFQRI